MRLLIALFVVFSVSISNAQFPPRLQIPGASLVSQPRAGGPFRAQQRLTDTPPPPRVRRPPIPNAIPAPVRPVVEEPEEGPAPITASNNFEDEVTKLGISALQTAVRQSLNQDEEAPRPVQFRPERPVPVLRQDIRDRENVPRQEVKERPILRQENIPRPLLRQQDLRDEGFQVPLRQPQPVRQHVRQQVPPQPTPHPQPNRQPTRAHRPPPPQLDEDGRPIRARKPPVQILRKYRTDNPDGSITWGFENEDGTFKEETLGIDCVTRGKYGYIDPDGVRREYSYETGNKCDEPEEEEELLPQRPENRPQFVGKKPQLRPQ